MMHATMARMGADDFSLEARRSTRVPIRVPVRLGIKADEGPVQTLVAWTIVLSRYGARIECKRPLDVYQEVTVTTLAGKEQTGTGRVVWCTSKRNDSGNFEVGLEIREANSLWGIAFPPG